MKKIIILSLILSILIIGCETTKIIRVEVEKTKVVEKETVVVSEEYKKEKKPERKDYYPWRTTPPEMIKIWFNLENGIIKMPRARSSDIKGELYFHGMKRQPYGGMIIYIWNKYHDCYYFFAAPPKEKEGTCIVEAFLVK